MSTIINFLDTANLGQTFIDAFLSDSLRHDGVKERSGRYDYGSGARPYQHDPHERELYLSVKQDGTAFGLRNGFSKESADRMARTVVDNWDIDMNSISTGDEYLNSYREKYSIGKNVYERKKYASPVFNTNPSNEELTSIKNRKKLEKDVQDSFEVESEAKSHNSNQNKSTNTKKDPWARTEKGGKDKPNISLAERTARDIKNTTDDLINGTSKILKSMYDNKKLKNNAKGLSNEELRDRIARIRLEKEYNQLTAKNTHSGYEKTMRILNTIGTVVTVGAGVVSIAAGFKNMKSGGKNEQ